MNEDELRKIEINREHKRKLVRARRIRAANYNQELEDSIADYRQKNEVLRAAIEAMTNEIFRLMNMRPSNHVQPNLKSLNMLPLGQSNNVLCRDETRNE